MIGDRTKDQSPKGYVLEFACTYGGGYPDDLQWGDDWDGWQMRRAIADFCDKAGLKDYKIIRNTSYVKDLHGPRVYELYSKALSSQPQKGKSE